MIDKRRHDDEIAAPLPSAATSATVVHDRHREPATGTFADVENGDPFDELDEPGLDAAVI